MIVLFDLVILTACSSTGNVTILPQPTPTEVRVLPTSSASGDTILWQGLQVTMDQAEITEDFITKFGSIRIPSPGDKFLWVSVLLKNVGNPEIHTPR